MSASHETLLSPTDIERDLSSGRSQPLRPTDRLLRLETRRRPTTTGPRALATALAARALGAVHPRLARPALLRLWLTPWVHPTARRTIDDLPVDLVPWSLETAEGTLHGYAGGVGPTAVMVHGWAGRAADLRHIAADLIASGWRVVAPDLPAHGATAGRTTDVLAMSRALAGVLGHERPAALVAHSFGFPVTTMAIEEGADVPATIVALAPGRRMRHALDGFVRRARLPQRLARELRLAIEDRWGEQIWQELDVDDALPGLPPGGVVIHDRDDDDVAHTDGCQIAAAWPGATLVTTEGLGHRRILRDAGVRAVVIDALG